ncbi:serine/threonine protein phosphatase, partial [Streptomyces sp. TRM76130]|nr:serine/threonine protein phosphatase [Streptomyces sp. TRM76130]
MDSTRVTEHPISFEHPPAGTDPTDPRGALLHTPAPPRAPASPRPAQDHAEAAAVGGDPVDVSEHAQPGTEQPAGPDAHRPRPVPAPEDVPAPSGGVPVEQADRRSGQPRPPGQPTPMRRDGDRLRFVGAA